MLADRGVMSDTPRVEIAAQTTTMIVLAGESAEQELTLVNLTPLPDDFELSVEGLPSGWYSFSRDSVNLFPNWSDTVRFKIIISPKVRPNQYIGKIVVTSKTQPNVRGEFRVEIEVLSPLKVQARLDPRKASGHKANYKLILRNRSMTEGVMNLQLTRESPWCVGEFFPPQIRLLAGKNEEVRLTVRLNNKTPSDQKVQTQNFEVQILPTWLVGQTPVNSPSVLIDGEYIPQSRWVFIQRHPFFTIFGTLFVILVVVWQLFLFNNIQSGLLLVTERVDYKGRVDPRAGIRVEQNAFSRTAQAANPLNSIVPVEVRFIEPTQKTEIWLRFLWIDATMSGVIDVDSVTGNLFFKPDNPNQASTFPWFFAPPDRMVNENLNKKLKDWLKNRQQTGQSVNLRATDTYIEGNTLFIRVRGCRADDDPKACPR